MRNSTIGLLFSVGLLVAGIIGLAVGIYNRQADANLAANGKHVTGVVRYAQEHRSESGTGTHRTENVWYSLIVDYPIERGSQRAEFNVNYMAFLTHKAGTS